MDNNKMFQVQHHLNPQILTQTVILNGVHPDEKLTPKLARRAACVAQGHDTGVTVWSGDDFGYRLYENSARKVYPW